MKRMAAVSAVVVVFVWAVMHFSRKPSDPTVEQMAEKFGRAARTRMSQKNQAAPPQGLQINETSTEAPAQTTSSGDPASMMANLQSQATPEENAKARVTALLTAMQSGAKLKAAAIWAHGLQPDALDDLAASSQGFTAFLHEKGLSDKLTTFEVERVMRRANGQEQYTAVDVTLDGVMYHVAVPDSATSLSWTF
jgi:hypothetical protein